MTENGVSTRSSGMKTPRNGRSRPRPLTWWCWPTAAKPPPGASALAGYLGVRLDDNQFFDTDPLNPLSTNVPGIYACGCAQGPMDIPESVAQASSAAAKAAEVVLKAGD